MALVWDSAVTRIHSSSNHLHQKGSSAPSSSSSPSLSVPLITILADDDALANSLFEALSIGSAVDDDDAHQCCSGRGVRSFFVPNDTGSGGGGTRIVIASRQHWLLPVSSIGLTNSTMDTNAESGADVGGMGTDAGEGEGLSDGDQHQQRSSSPASAAAAAISSLSSSTPSPSLPTISPATQFAACGATQQGAVVLAVRGGIDGQRPHTSELMSQDGEGGRRGGAAAAGADTAAVTIEDVVAWGMESGGGKSHSNGIISYSSTLYNTSVHSLLLEAAAIASVAAYCCPMLGAAGAVASLCSPNHNSSGGGDGRGRGDAIKEAPLPAHLVILNVVTPPFANKASHREQDGTTTTNNTCKSAIPPATLASLSATLEHAMFGLEPLYTTMTMPAANQNTINSIGNSIHHGGSSDSSCCVVSVRDEGAVSRNDARMLIGGGGGGGAGFSSRTVVSITDPSFSSSSSSFPTADLSPTDATRYSVRSQLSFIWQLAAQHATQSNSSSSSPHPSSLPPPILSIIRPSPQTVASRVAMLVSVTSTPATATPQTVFANLAQMSAKESSPSANDAQRGHGGGSGGGASAAVVISEAHRLWCELYVRTAIQEGFYSYCQSRQLRLTVPMVEAAYANVLSDCEKVCALVLGHALVVPLTTTPSADSSPSPSTEQQQQQLLLANALNIKGRLQEGLARFMAIANHNAAKQQQQGQGGGGGLKGLGLGGLGEAVGSGFQGASTATEGVRIAFNRLRNDHRTRAVTTRAVKGAHVIMAHTSQAALIYQSLVEAHVPPQYRFWFTGHGALIVVGIVLFLILSFAVRRE